MNKDWLDIDVLEDYLDGKLDAKGMHFVERQELDDPFVADALQGLRCSPRRKQSLSVLQKRLYERISAKPVKRKMWGITTQRLSIAATATVAFIAVSILFFMRENNRKSADIATRKAKGVIVNLDTNGSVAVVKPRLQDTLGKVVDGRVKSASISEAIRKVKTNSLAKNNKPIESERIASRVYLNQKTTDIAAEAYPTPAIALQSARMALAAVLQNVENYKTITGKVIAEVNGKPLPGASIKVTGLNHAVSTDKDGLFTINIDSSLTKELSVGYIGFETAKAVIDGQKSLIISLKEDQTALNEVVTTSTADAKKLTKASVAKRNTIILSGNVVDQIFGKPIESAVVKLAGTKNTTATDANGFFALPIDSNVKARPLSINAIGFKEISVNEWDSIKSTGTLNKSLNEIAPFTSLDGTKVQTITLPKIILQAERNLDVKSFSDITKPIPASNINYEEYLKSNNKFYRGNVPSQFVIITFRIGKNGRPVDIAVIKSLNAQADAEAKRLVQTGPNWILPNTGTDQVEISVKF